jgi:drug/metabolite transporter (DMT)-like permease
MTSSSRGAGAALLAVALWATNAFAASEALQRLGVWQLLAVQYGSAALALGLWRGVSSLPRLAGGAALGGVTEAGGRPGVMAVATGVLGLTGTIFLQYWAFATAPILGANVIAYGWPLMAALWSAATVRSRQALVGVPLAALGFVGVATILVGDGTARLDSNPGYLIALGSAACMAFYTVATGRVAASVTDLLLPATIVGVALALGVSALSGRSWPPVWHWWPAVYIGIGPMAAGYALWTYAMADRRAERLGPIGYATPLLSTLLLVATGQPVTRSTVIGAVLILACSAGVLLNAGVTRRRRRPPRCDL